MPTYFRLDPQVPGGFGEAAELDTSTHPPTVTRMHLELDDWSGPDLIESLASFAVTERLAKALQTSGFTGFELDEALITASEEFEELYPAKVPPAFKWLRITGKAGEADFGMSPKHRLVVSDTALALLKRFDMSECDIEPYRA